MGAIESKPTILASPGKCLLVLICGTFTAGLYGFLAAKATRYFSRKLKAQSTETFLEAKRQQMQRNLQLMRVTLNRRLLQRLSLLAQQRLQQRLRQLQQLQIQRQEELRVQLQERLNQAALEMMEPLQRAQQQLLRAWRMIEKRHIQQERIQFARLVETFASVRLHQTDDLESEEEEDNEDSEEPENTKRVLFYERAPAGC